MPCTLENLLVELEGLHTHMYLNSSGIPAIGVGHELTRSERMSGKLWVPPEVVKWREGLSEEQCRRLLDHDVFRLWYAGGQITPTEAQLTPDQRLALQSFVFNIGREAFLESTLREYLALNRVDEVPAQMRRWIYRDGQIVEGLRRRRDIEVSIWNGDA